MDLQSQRSNASNGSDASQLIQTLDVYYWEQILVATFLALIAIAGLIGNSMIILAVSFSRKLHTSTNAFVVNLSIADLITSFFLIFYTIGVLGKESWPLPEAYWICQLTSFMIYVCTGVSLYNLAAIGINRLVLISKPLIYPNIFRSWKLAICLAIPWIVPIASFISAVYSGLGKFGYDPSDLACAAIDTEKNDVGISLIIIIAGFPIPILAITISYTWIFVITKRHFQRLNQWQNSMTSISNSSSEIKIISDGNVLRQGTRSSSMFGKQKVSRTQIKITQNLFLVMCSFFLCFLPYFILIFIPNVYHILFYTRMITLSNSAINFAIYANKHPEFKVILRHMIRCSYQDIPQPTKLLKLFINK